VFLTARVEDGGMHRVGEGIDVEAVLHARSLPEVDMRVEVVYGPAGEKLEHALHVHAMEMDGANADGSVRYHTRFTPMINGRLALGVRVYPVHPDLAHPFDLGAIRWAT
jgi:hypothetical protein